MVSKNTLIPVVLEREGNSERTYDLYSNMLSKRIIFLQGEITDELANLVVSQLLFLEAQDPKLDITMYINSLGGSVTAGLAITNTMNYITCDVCTVGMGMCASMGAFILGAGTKGKRFVLKDTTVMIHQVLGGFQGQATDVAIHADYIKFLKEKLNNYLSYFTYGKINYKKMTELCERDNFLCAEKALELGLIDKVLDKRPKL